MISMPQPVVSQGKPLGPAVCWQAHSCTLTLSWPSERPESTGSRQGLESRCRDVSRYRL